MRPTGTAEELESRRRKCFELLDAGKTATEIAEMLGVARTSIQRWKAMVRENGKRALKAIPQHVPECRMTSEQQKELGKIIADGALAADIRPTYGQLLALPKLSGSGSRFSTTTIM